MKKLIEFISTIPKGHIRDPKILESLLKSCWSDFIGSDMESMQGYKLVGRMEKVYWDVPILTFEVERHGATAMGSSRASIHKWTLNLEDKTATCTTTGYKQLYKRQSVLNVKKIVDELLPIILANKKDDRLKWYNDGIVRILIGKIISPDSAVKQTVANRRKRFRKAMDKALANSGWIKIKNNYYAPG